MEQGLMIIVTAILVIIVLSQYGDDSFDDTDKDLSQDVLTAGDYEEWEVLGEFENEVQAQIVADWLESEGIPAISQTENPTITEGAAFLLNQRVKVNPNQLERARKQLDNTKFEPYLNQPSTETNFGQEPDPDLPEWPVVYQDYDLSRIHSLNFFLESEGISTMLEVESPGTYSDGVAIKHQLRVKPDQVNEAEKVITEWETSEP